MSNNTAKNSYQAANGLRQMQKQSPKNCSLFVLAAWSQNHDENCTPFVIEV